MRRLDISELAKLHGADRLRFFVPTTKLRTMFFGLLHYTDSSDEQVIQECVVDESGYNRKVVDGYKIVLQPLDDSYAAQEFYQMDLESLMHSDPERFRVTPFPANQEDTH